MLNPTLALRLLLLFILWPVLLSAQFISGKWEAKFKLDNEECYLLLNITEDLSGTNYTIKRSGQSWTESFQMYMQSENHVEFELSGINYMQFKGLVNADNKKVTGNMIYKENEYPVTFIKTGEAEQTGTIGEQIFIPDSNLNIVTDTVEPAKDDTNSTESPIILNSEFSNEEIAEAEATPGFNYRPLVLWASFWIIICFLLWLKFRKRGLLNEQAVIATTPEENETVNKLLPLVRLGRRRVDKTRGLIVTDSSLVFFRKKLNRSVETLHTQEGVKEIDDCKAVRRNVIITNENVEKVLLEKATRMGRNLLKIFTSKKTFKFTLPAYEIPNLLTTLRSRFSSLLFTQQPIRFHAWGLLILLIILTLVPIIALSINMLVFEAPPGIKIPGDILLSLICIGGMLLLFLIPIIITMLDHIPAAPQKIVAKKKRKDRSHSQPFRSVPISILLKLIGIVLFIFIYSSKLYSSFSEEAEQEFPELKSISWFVPYLVVGMILSVSYSLAQRNPNNLRKKNRKKPILYLRSFADDRETTLNLRNRRSFIMGVDPPYFFLEQYDIGERTWLNKFTKGVIRILYRFHPLFLLRLMFGNPKETSEQQLGKYLSKYGFFIAIGKPGEKIVTTGASRMYVTNEEWQQVVLDLMQESSFVVLQPSRTKGVWWEVEQVFKRQPPEKILLSLVNYHGFQDDYETFRLRMENLFPDHPPLPSSIGNESRIAFMSFNSNWEPVVYYLKNYWLLSWPFRGSTANLHATLKPYLKSLQHT